MQLFCASNILFFLFFSDFTTYVHIFQTLYMINVYFIQIQYNTFVFKFTYVIKKVF